MAGYRIGYTQAQIKEGKKFAEAAEALNLVKEAEPVVVCMWCNEKKATNESYFGAKGILRLCNECTEKFNNLTKEASK